MILQFSDNFNFQTISSFSFPCNFEFLMQLFEAAKQRTKFSSFANCSESLSTSPLGGADFVVVTQQLFTSIYSSVENVFFYLTFSILRGLTASKNSLRSRHGLYKGFQSKTTLKSDNFFRF